MLNLTDFLVSGFIFLLFASIYRKRPSAAVQCWAGGWMCIVLHFAVLLWTPAGNEGRSLQDILSLSMLVLCGTAFSLSSPQTWAVRWSRWQMGSLLGLPPLLALTFVVASERWLIAAQAATVFSLCSVLCGSAALFGIRRQRFAWTALITLGCYGWLLRAVQTHDQGALACIVLTQCFGLNAISFFRRSRTAAISTLTTSFGAVSWSLVWVTATLQERFWPGLTVSAEVWNLPKYFLAAGMVLSLLDDEIRKAEMASERYRLLFAGSPHPMWIFDPVSLAFHEVNDAAAAQYGFSRAEFQAMSVPDVMCLAEDPEALALLRTEEPQLLTGPWLHRRKDGTEFQVEMASQPVAHGNGRATFALMHDVTEPQRLHAQLIRQAHHDVLTGLPNRALFEESMGQALEEARRASQAVALFCIDLDRFKQINDTYGHSAGDRCLCELAERITNRLQGAGMLARTGGDEFMLLMGGIRDAATAEHLAALLLYDLKAPVALETAEVELVASIGVAIYPDDGIDGAQLWRDADAAMYRAKRAGGSQWVRVSREISRETSEASDIELNLRRTLRAGDLSISYQPQVLANGELYGMEALVRFSDPLLAEAPAIRVITIAEESGLIVPLGEWVLEEVCRQGRAWLDEGLRPVQIALNVSPLQLQRHNFSLKVASTLERYQLSPHMLEFEVTESTMMPDSGDAPDQIRMLAHMGIRFSVDDFGTGYSSLGRLHQLPVDSLKIDGSFTRQMVSRKGTYPTVRAIIGLAHSFGMKVVAEGVETEEQLRLLKNLKCDRIQGYLVSKPLPAEEVRVFLAPEQEYAGDTLLPFLVAESPQLG